MEAELENTVRCTEGLDWRLASLQAASSWLCSRADGSRKEQVVLEKAPSSEFPPLLVPDPFACSELDLYPWDHHEAFWQRKTEAPDKGSPGNPGLFKGPGFLDKEVLFPMAGPGLETIFTTSHPHLVVSDVCCFCFSKR